jgi:hypothetical protein
MPPDSPKCPRITPIWATATRSVPGCASASVAMAPATRAPTSKKLSPFGRRDVARSVPEGPAEFGVAPGYGVESQAVPGAEIEFAKLPSCRRGGSVPPRSDPPCGGARQVGRHQKGVTRQIRVEPVERGTVGQVGGHVPPAGERRLVGRAVPDPPEPGYQKRSPERARASSSSGTCILRPPPSPEACPSGSAEGPRSRRPRDPPGRPAAGSTAPARSGRCAPWRFPGRSRRRRRW